MARMPMSRVPGFKRSRLFVKYQPILIPWADMAAATLIVLQSVTNAESSSMSLFLVIYACIDHK